MDDISSLTAQLLRDAVARQAAERLRRLADALDEGAEPAARLLERVRGDLDALELLGR